MCVTLYDWRTFPQQFAKTRDPDEKVLYRILNDQVGPTVIEALVVCIASRSGIVTLKSFVDQRARPPQAGSYRKPQAVFTDCDARARARGTASARASEPGDGRADGAIATCGSASGA